MIPPLLDRLHHRIELAAATTIAGTVRDARGAAVPGARITASGAHSWSVVACDDRGEFTISDVSRGTYRLRATSETYVEGPPVAVVVADAPIHGVVVDVVDGATIAGVVVDHTGAPVAEAWVRADGRDARSGADGTFALRPRSKRDSGAMCRADSTSPRVAPNSSCAWCGLVP